MRKKLTGIYLNAPLTETDIVNLGRNLDREIIINSTIVSDGVIDTKELTNYIMTFEYDSTLDGGSNHIRRSIPTLELLGNTDPALSGSHWIRIAEGEYKILTSANRLQDTIEEIDEELFKRKVLLHIIDAVGNGSLVTSNDAITPNSTLDSGNHLIAFGDSHSITYATNSIIMGGIESIIEGDNTADSTYGIGSTTIPADVSGYTIQYASIIGGYGNYIKGNSDYAGIFGGDKNEILNNSLHALISGGAINKIYGYTDLSTIVGGVNSNIYGSTVDLKTRAGIFQSISSYVHDSVDSVILGGAGNYIVTSNHSGSINSWGSYIYDSSTSMNIGANGSHTRYSYNTSIISSLGPNSDIYYPYAIFTAVTSSIIASEGSAIANSSNGIIAASKGSFINDFDPTGSASSSITTVNSDHLILANVTGFYVGALVYIHGADKDKTTEYMISSISDNAVYFNTPSGVAVTFSGSTGGTVVTLRPTKSTYTILSNTSDTFIFSDNNNISLTDRTYVYINGLPVKRYKFETNVTGTSHRLIDYDTKEVVTGLTANAFMGATAIIVSISTGYSTDTNSIISSEGSYIYRGDVTSIISGKGSYIIDAYASSIFASDGSHIKYATQCIVAGGGGNYIEGLAGTFLYNASICGGQDNSIYETAHHSFIGAGKNNYIYNGAAFSFIGAGQNNYINSIASHSFIGAGLNNKITDNSIKSFIAVGDNNTIINSVSSFILGTSNTISNYNYVHILGSNITANRSNFTNIRSLYMWDKKLVLNGATDPIVGDTLVVDSVNGSEATLKWGIGTSTGLGVEAYDIVMSGATQLLTGARTSGGGVHYITISSYNSTYEQIHMGITCDGYNITNAAHLSSYDYVFSPTANNGGVFDGTGIPIDDGYTYSITYEVTNIQWGGSNIRSAPTLTLAINTKTKITSDVNVVLTNDSNPSVNMTIDKLTTNRNLVYTSTDASDDTAPTRSSNPLQLYQIYNPTSKYLTLALGNLYESVLYSISNSASYSTNSTGEITIDWTDVNGPSPSVGHVIAFWDNGENPYTQDGSQYTVTNYTELSGRKYVTISGNRAPNQSNIPCHIRYDDASYPTLSASIKCKVTRIKNSTIDILKEFLG